MKILIVGSSTHLNEKDRQKFNASCIELGKEIAKRGHKIITCSASKNTADYYVIKGFCLQSPNSEIIMYRPSMEVLSEDPDTDIDQLFTDKEILCKQIKQRVVNGGWRPVHLRAIKDVDIVIALGGRNRGTGQVIYFSEIEYKPVVVIPVYGGTAKDIWTDIKHLYNEDVQAKLSQKPEIRDWAKNIIDAAEIIIKSNIYNNVKLRDNIVKLAIGLILIICWFYLFLSKQPLLEDELIFIGMVLSASIMGSTLRNVLIRRNIILSDWGISNYIVECLIGLILILPVYCIPQIFAFMLTGKPAAITNLEDARRIGFEISIFGFIAALFQEEAFEKSGKFLRGLIK
jgi:hypothetical protein